MTTVRPGEDVAKLVKRMHYVSFVGMFRSDLFEGLCVGHAPKKCRICGKWFLTTNARHTKYCGGYAPGDKLHRTCRQIGNQVFTADNALKYMEFAIKAATNSLQFEEIPNYADAMMLQRYTAVFGHLAYSLGEYQTAMLDFAEKSDGNEADRTAEGFARMFGSYFPAGVLYHGGQCLDVYPEQFRSVCIGHPSRRKSCKARQANPLCILCGDVPV